MMQTLLSGRHSQCTRRTDAIRGMSLCVVGVLALAAAGCGELEPIVEPEIVDMQLTLDTLRTQVRDAQRNLAEVRAELESRRQELADAQVARAQLEGRVREAERRVSEARHVIEIQREELLAARAERERVFRSSTQLHGQTRPLQRKSTKPGAPQNTEQAQVPMPTGAAYQWSFGTPLPSATPAVNSLPGKRAATPAAMNQNSPVREIIVKPGDTLWSLARTYRIGLDRLRRINHLTDNQIEVGQVLVLSEYGALTEPSAETSR
jgi:LysM repeat protein